MKNRIALIILILLLALKSDAQEKVTTFGIQLKPIIPLEFFNAGKQEVNNDGIQYINQPKFGMSFGMVIRKGLTKNISLETGLNFLKRNFDLTINDPDSSFSGTSDFSIVNYEIPLLCLVYVELSRKIFMNVAGGVSFDIYPTPLYVEDDYFTNAINRTFWVQPSLLANVGWEYRTEKSGYIYFGASLHRSFDKIFTEYVAYTHFDQSANRVVDDEAQFNLTGNYFTIDIRYFFHEEKQKKRKKEKRFNRQKEMRKIREGRSN
ncbi:MAG: outer membrane beta-barrel protein [Vicingaceae bacterium]